MLSARDAAGALARGFAQAGVEADELPLADGGDGTAEVLYAALGGEWGEAEVSDPFGRRVAARFLVLPDGRAVVEAAQTIGLARIAPGELDPVAASSRGLGELILAAGPHARELLVALGGSATVDGGAGLREVLVELPLPTTVACDVANPLLGERGAARTFGPQKGATAEQVEELEARLGAMEELRPAADLAGAGAAGGLGAALAVLGARLVPGAELVLEALGFRERIRGAAVVVTGEGVVDRTSGEGKAPGVVLRICREEGVRCVVFGGRIVEPLAGAEHEELSGDPTRARDDLVALGERLGLGLTGAVAPGA
ncbi:MAG: glycerate kinase [Gaiellaceae bacterium]